MRHLGNVQVKGKTDSVGVYECFDGDAKEIISKKASSLEDFDQALKAFFSKEFPTASATFDRIKKLNPEDKVADYFLKKSAQYTVAGVEESWSGLEKLEGK
jgi:hypothetical protein